MATVQLTQKQKRGEHLIPLDSLDLERFDQNSNEPESTAVKLAVKHASTNKLTGLVVSFTSRKRPAKVTLVLIKKLGIPGNHPQCVRHVNEGYYAMTNNA
jgi:hypothetical protein